MTLHEHIQGIIDRTRYFLGLDRWTILLQSGPLADARAACSAEPEYRAATIMFDPDKLQTGDDVAEVTVHELAHCHTWPLHAVAENLAHMVAECAPEHMREALKAGLVEEVRKAAETTTTDVGHTYLRLLRRAELLDTPVAHG